MENENIKAQVYSQENNPVQPREKNSSSFMKRGTVTSITLGDKTFEVLDKEFANAVQIKLNELNNKNAEILNSFRIQNTKIEHLESQLMQLKLIVKSMGQDILKNNWK